MTSSAGEGGEGFAPGWPPAGGGAASAATARCRVRGAQARLGVGRGRRTRQEPPPLSLCRALRRPPTRATHPRHAKRNAFPHATARPGISRGSVTTCGPSCAPRPAARRRQRGCTEQEGEPVERSTHARWRPCACTAPRASTAQSRRCRPRRSPARRARRAPAELRAPAAALNRRRIRRPAAHEHRHGVRHAEPAASAQYAASVRGTTSPARPRTSITLFPTRS